MKKTILTLITLLLLNCQSTVKTENSSYGLEEIRVNQTYYFVYREGYDFAPLTKVFEVKATRLGWKRN
ncbi:hypothetical protein [Leptospira vanthielii]|uniref:hypothetical protein n=1 Tax=Leptospira vanthielii TaxID=293085 RepID=UPI0012FA0379|nr:hypothetical protein [Leptospira vanthielii]